MKKRRNFLLAAALLSLPLFSWARSEIELESFEDNIDNCLVVASQGGASPRGNAGNVRLSHFTKTDDSEVWVTAGNKCLMIELLNDQKFWAMDFKIVLDAESAARLKAVWDPDPDTGQKPLARYVLKYDLTFPEAGVVFWMNQALNNHWEAAQEYNTLGNNLKPLTVAIPLDLVDGSLLLNDDGTADLRFIDNADWTDGNTPTFYIDNIRLVDQWAGETPPTTIVIESFESGIGSASLTEQEGRARMQEYTATGPDDPKVIHGSKSLEVVLGQPEGWRNDLSLDLSGSEKLKELLRLPESERSRYILRFDALFQARPPEGWGGGGWGYKFSSSASLADTARMPSDLAIYSVNLASAALDAENPRITFYGNGGYGGEVVTYLDNIRILDTGAPTLKAPAIKSAVYDRQSKQFTISWEAEPGATFRVNSSTDLADWSTVVADNYPSGGAISAIVSISLPVNEADRARFFRIARLAQ